MFEVRPRPQRTREHAGADAARTKSHRAERAPRRAREPRPRRADADDSGGSPPAPRTQRRRRRVGWRILLGAFLIIALALIAARLYLPFWLQDYVNRTLDQSPTYDGRVGEIGVHLWRGAYSIHDLDIVKTTLSVPVPFFESPRVDFSLDWGALFKGLARGRVRMEQPRINFVHGPSPEESQTGADQPWLDMIDQLFPFRIDKAEIVEGEIHFQAFHTEPQVDVYLSEVNAAVENLTNVENSLDPLIATVTATGVAMDHADFEFDMRLDPQSHRPNFNLAARLIGLDLTRINALSLAYGDFDFEAGRFDFVVELSTKDGFLEGYAKPLFREAQVLGPRDVETDDPLRLFWEALVGIVGEIFTNQPRDQFGTLINIEGNLNDPRTDLLEIIGNVLYNAFVRAYLPRYEGSAAPDAATPEDEDDDAPESE